MSRILPLLTRLSEADHPPKWCFQANADGELPTCTYTNGAWHRSYDSGMEGGGSGIAGLFVVLFVLVLLGGIAFTIWKVSTARRMARDAGLSESDATAMALLSDDGFEATYLASSMRRPPRAASAPTAPGRSSAERLRELASLPDEGLISPDEYDARRRAVLDGL